MQNYTKYLIDIYKMVEYYRTEGTISLDNIDNKTGLFKNVDEIYELIDFFENYILNYNLYVYDRLSQELFLKLFRTKKINGLDVILQNKLDEIKKITKNKAIIGKIEYIIENSYKINSIKKFRELIEILKSLKIKNTDDLENLIFVFNKLIIIKDNKFIENDIEDILNFVSKFKLNNINKIKEEIKEIIVDFKNINNIYKKFHKEIEFIKSNKILDKIINILDKTKN